MASFDELATVAASTKRAGTIVSGLEQAAAAVVASLKCLPLDAVTPDVALGIEGLGWQEILQTTVKGNLDIVEGDLLVVGSTEYPIRAVADYTWKSDVFQVLYLEDKK